MTLREWLTLHGFSMYAFGKMAKVTTATIRNLCLGRPPTYKTVKRFMRVTKNFKPPITPDMFPVVYTRGSGTLTRTEDLFKKEK